MFAMRKEPMVRRRSAFPPGNKVDRDNERVHLFECFDDAAAMVWPDGATDAYAGIARRDDRCDIIAADIAAPGEVVGDGEDRVAALPGRSSSFPRSRCTARRSPGIGTRLSPRPLRYCLWKQKGAGPWLGNSTWIVGEPDHLLRIE
jgi:hypothetical protein